MHYIIHGVFTPTGIILCCSYCNYIFPSHAIRTSLNINVGTSYTVKNICYGFGSAQTPLKRSLLNIEIPPISKATPLVLILKIRRFLILLYF